MSKKYIKSESGLGSCTGIAKPLVSSWLHEKRFVDLTYSSNAMIFAAMSAFLALIAVLASLVN